MLVSTMRSAVAAGETAGLKFSGGLCCNSIALLCLTNAISPGVRRWGRGRSDREGAAFGLAPATTSAAGAGSQGNSALARPFSDGRKELMHGSGQKDDTFAQASSTQISAPEEHRRA